MGSDRAKRECPSAGEKLHLFSIKVMAKADRNRNDTQDGTGKGGDEPPTDIVGRTQIMKTSG